ncbi:LacI family DNA-binding transcriptional regulator [Tissierella sp.]|uniref:LacI family DNA-binding transcriptional regulator n=1 Tax=Tissierella sp. TaxID=41274 RepID=UPI0028AA540D|nr:LacI family DNA-binding transcriptional regulator [Tissierella sp.]
MVKQQDIADKLNISRATVSRALKGQNVSEKTRQLVLKEAEKMGYVANSAATVLALKNTKKVYAFIIATVDEGYGQQTYEGIKEASNIWQGYNLEIEVIFTDINIDKNQCKTQIEQFYEVIETNSADGIIFSALSKENMEIVTMECKKRNIPLMTLDMIYKNSELFHVGPDYYNLGTYSAAYIANLMMKKGKILILSYDEGYELSKERMRGFHEKLKEYPLIQEYDVELDTMSRESYFEALNKYFYKYNPIAIYAPYHADYIGEFLNRKGLKDKVILITNGINKEIENYLFDGTIDGIVSARPYFLGAVVANNFHKYFYRPREIFKGEIDVACDIYIKENYIRYDKIF